MDKSKKVFGISIEEVQRQINAQQSVKFEFDLAPINAENEMLEPVINGGKKILKDHKLREQVRKVLVG